VRKPNTEVEDVFINLDWVGILQIRIILFKNCYHLRGNHENYLLVVSILATSRKVLCILSLSCFSHCFASKSRAITHFSHLKVLVSSPQNHSTLSFSSLVTVHMQLRSQELRASNNCSLLKDNILKISFCGNWHSRAY